MHCLVAAKRAVPTIGTLVLLCTTTVFAQSPDQYLVGDWDGDGKDNLAVRVGGRILMDYDFDGKADAVQVYGNGASESQYLSGDWDGDGKDNIGLRRGNTLLLDTNFDGFHDITMMFGEGSEEYLVGDWNGDGRDNIGIRVRNKIQIDTDFDGSADDVMTVGRPADRAYYASDWDGDGRTDVVVRRRARFFSDSGRGRPTELPYVVNGEKEEYLFGDWNGDGKDDLALRRDEWIEYDSDGDGRTDKRIAIGLEEPPAAPSPIEMGEPVTRKDVEPVPAEVTEGNVVTGNVVVGEVATPEPADTRTPTTPTVAEGEVEDVVVPTPESPEEETAVVRTADPTTLVVSTPSGTPSEGIAVVEGDQSTLLLTAGLTSPYRSPAGVFMFDGWDQPTRPILEEAAKMLLSKRGTPTDAAAVDRFVEELKTNPVTRWEFAPFMLRTAWSALVAENPTPAQQAFVDRFNNFSALDDNIIARQTLELWNNYIGLNPIGTPTYDPVTLSTLLDTGPSIQGFLPLPNPLFIGESGEAALTLLYKPMVAHSLPEFDDEEHLRGLDDEMTNTAIAVGVGGGAGAAAVFTAAFGMIPVYQSMLTARLTSKLKADIKARELGDLIIKKGAKKAGETAAKKVGEKAAEEVAKKAFSQIVSKLTFGGAVLGGVAFFASVFAEALADFIKTKEYDANLRERASRITPFDVRVFLGPYPSVDKRAMMFTQMVKMLITDPADWEGLSFDLPDFPCQAGYGRADDGYCVLEVRYHAQPGLSIDQAQEIALQNSWRLASADELQAAYDRLGFEAYAYGMLADGRFAFPIKAPSGQYPAGTNVGITIGNQGFFHTQRVEFKEWEGLSQKQVEDILGHEGSRLANAAEIQTAWEKQGLDVLAYGMIEGGQFAIPIQSDKGGWARGPNIGAQGGNQGFFFVRNAAQTPGGMYYRGQQAMQCQPGAETIAGLCYTPCQSGYRGVGTLCYQNCPTGFRDDGLYCGKPGSYTREGFAWQIGDPPLPNYSGPTSRCEAKYGSGACEQWGALIYPKCQTNFHAAGCCVCSPDCPSGWNDIGVSCQKPSYDRGVGKPVEYCPPGTEQVGALCYPLCRQGFRGQLDWCYKN